MRDPVHVAGVVVALAAAAIFILMLGERSLRRATIAR